MNRRVRRFRKIDGVEYTCYSTRHLDTRAKQDMESFAVRYKTSIEEALNSILHLGAAELRRLGLL